MSWRMIGIVLVMSLPLSTYAQENLKALRDEVTKRREALTEIDKKIKHKRSALKKTEEQELSTISQLNIIDKKLSKNREELTYLNHRLQLISQAADTTTTQITQMEEEIAQRRKIFNQRLVALYKFERRGGILQVIFSSPSHLEALQRLRFISLILRRDTQILQQFLLQLSQTKQKRQMLTEKQEAIEKIKSDILKKTEEIEEQKRQKTALLETIKHEKKMYQEAVRELEKSSSELQSLIERLERELLKKKKHGVPLPDKGFAALKGKLPMPAQGNVISYFGNHFDPQLNAVTFQKGIEISTKWGEEIRSIYKGTVLYADWFKGYGNIIIIDHGDSYYSLVAHLSKILKGVEDQVESGEVIALSGDTGSLKGPCVYFEIRHEGKPLDPLEWLQPQ